MTQQQDNTPPRTREELYTRIRETSKAEFILEEMIRLGFWPAHQEMPYGPAHEIKRMAELKRELSGFRTELNRLKNQEAMLKAIRKRRMQESRQKQRETKKRREQERLQRAENWKQAKEKDIVYLGSGVSAGLGNKDGDTPRLKQYQLPVFSSAAGIAAAMGISVGHLRFLAFSRDVSRTTHYRRFYIPKKSGGQRLISAPMPRLKTAQYWVLENILKKVPVHDAAHGFLPGRSIVGNARPHVGQDVVINLDLKDFFPTITYKRVKGLFRSFGYSEHAATIFALLCTEPDVDQVAIDGERYYVKAGERHLPQGAPSSPMLTNIICRRLDRRLIKLAETFGFIYTRYADDITFSGSREKIPEIGKLLAKTRGIIIHEGFTPHPDKTRILHRGGKQEVTGIVVNDKLSVDRKMLRRLRAALFQVEKDGVKGKRFGNSSDVIASMEGYIRFVNMVDPEKGAVLWEQLKRVKASVDYRRPVYKRPEKPASPPPRAGTVPASPDGKPWWKFW